MTAIATAEKPAAPKVGKTIVVAIVMGMAIAIVGVAPWVVWSPMNLRLHPELPWAAMSMLCWMFVMLLWLGGFAWPRSTSAFRWFHLRVWRPEPGAWFGANLATIAGLVAAIVGLYVMLIVTQLGRPPVDVSGYPTTAIRVSFWLIGALMSGVVEEAAFRGYMQSHLERIGPTFAILVTSLAFTLAHASRGLEYLLPMAPGLFLASVVFGYLALKTGSVVPGMILHSVGDASVAYFVLLGGNSALLIAN